MRNVNFLLSAFLMVSLVAGSCNKQDNSETIHEADKKFLSDSQLFALNKAIENDPDNSEYYYKRAKIYFERKDAARAINDINQALKLKGAQANYYFLQAKIYESLKNLPSALNAAKNAEVNNVEDAEIKILLSRLYMEMNEMNKSQKYLKEASFLTPYHAEVTFLQGKYLAITGDTVSALNNFIIVFKKDTSHAGTCKELTKIYFAKQKLDSAMAYLVSGRILDPEDPFYAYYEGRIFEQINLKDSAKKLYLTALKYDNTYSDAYRALAMMFYKSGMFDQAASYFEKELKYNSSSIKSNLLIAEIYENKDRGAEAIPYLENAIRLDSNNSRAKSSLEKLYKLYPKAVAPVKKDTIPAVDTVPVQKQDTVKKKTPPVIKSDTVRRRPPPKPATKNFTPIIKNPDSTKIDVRPDTTK